MRIGRRTPRNLLLIAIAVLFAATFHNRFLVLPVIGLCSLLLLIVCSFRSPLERVLPVPPSRFRPDLYRSDPGHHPFGLGSAGRSFVADLPVLRGVDGRRCGPLCRSQLGSSAGAQSAPINMAGKRRLARPTLLIAGAMVVLSLTPKAIDFHPPFWGSLARWLGMAMVLNLFAQVGDLVESAIKRGVAVKVQAPCFPATEALWTALTPSCWPRRCCGTLNGFSRFERVSFR